MFQNTSQKKQNESLAAKKDIAHSEIDVASIREEREAIIKSLSENINTEAEQKTWSSQEDKKKWAVSELQKRLPTVIEEFYKEKYETQERQKAELENRIRDRELRLEKSNTTLKSLENISLDKIHNEILTLPKNLLSGLETLNLITEAKNNANKKTEEKNSSTDKNKDALQAADISDNKAQKTSGATAQTENKYVLENIKTTYAYRDNNTFRSEKIDVSLQSDGSIRVLKEKGSDISDRFVALYLGSDNILRDQNGKKVDIISTATGTLSSSFVPKLFSSTNPSQGRILEVEDRYLRNYSHENKQIVFIKRNPPETNTSQTTSNLVQEEKKSQNISHIPWSSYKYIEHHQGQYIEKTAYVRVNSTLSTSRLEIFMGKNAQGEDIWYDASRVNRPALCLIHISKDGKEMKNEKGQTIESFHSVSGTRTTVESMKRYVDIDNQQKGKAVGFKKEYFNDLLYNGRRPVFIVDAK